MSDPFLLATADLGTDQQIVESLEQKVAAFIQTNGLFARGERILLAVSGGADSIALLAVMKNLTANRVLSAQLTCLHVNHGLRGASSDSDERFVIEQAEEMGIPCVTQAHDVSTYAAEHKLSTETAGRSIRLRSFVEVARTYGCTWIATGHHKDDNAETVIQRLRRGTGFRGLAAIVPARHLEANLWLARPLLCCTRAEIVAYLQSRRLSWRRDHTNTDCSYTRNYVRHQLLPYFQSQSNGSLVDELSALAGSAQQLRRRIDEQARQQAARHVVSKDGVVSVNSETLAGLPELVAVELIRLQLSKVGCGERDVTADHYKGILELARGASGRGGPTLPGGVQIRKEYGRIIFEPRSTRTVKRIDSLEVAVPGITVFEDRTIEARVLSHAEAATLDIRRDKTPCVEYLDLDRLDGSLVVRRRRSGDRFVPLGSSGRKKVGKFLTTAKVPESVRDDVLVFEDRQRIIWVCPIRIGEQAKLRRVTQRVLMLSVSTS